MKIERKLVECLRERNWKISAAESCTGGLFASTIISVPGASKVIDSSFVTYSDCAKSEFACVYPDTIEKYGVVSEQVAREMASGVRARAGAQVGVGITGFADGDNGGLVFVAIEVDGRGVAYKKIFGGSRNKVRIKAVRFTVLKVLDLLKSGRGASPSEGTWRYRNGALAGKFLPPQIGHAELIAKAATQCETLYVVLAENPVKSEQLCRDCGIAPIDAALRLKWLGEHFAGSGNIKFLYMNESGIPPYPHGTAQWSEEFKKVVAGAGGERIDAKFFGEEAYYEMNEKYFPESAAVLVKRGVETMDISASQIRANIKEYVKYVIPEGREYFEKL